MYTACFTGHRKIGGEYYNRMNPSADWMLLKDHLTLIVGSLIVDHKVDHFISGLAIGVDMLGAECVALCKAFGPDVKLTGAMPFPSQRKSWPKPTRNHWHDICSLCNEVVSISADPYHPSKMQIRNEWMVDHSNYVIAIWDGRKKGGTWNCIKYAQSEGKPVLHLASAPGGWTHSWLSFGD